VEEITAAKQEYHVQHGGTMDGTNCCSSIGGSFGVWDQSWESNRAVRVENVGDTDVINPWLSNGHKNFRNLKEIVAGALRPGMTEREKAIALWQSVHDPATEETGVAGVAKMRSLFRRRLSLQVVADERSGLLMGIAHELFVAPGQAVPGPFHRD
jgi:hypothetical protein